MSGESQYIHAEIYESSEVKLFAKNSREEPQNLAFLLPAMKRYLKSVIPGQKVLDIGCGSGNWSYKAAQSGAKSVDGFDIQEDMVQLAKQNNLVQSIYVLEMLWICLMMITHLMLLSASM